jgi:hypothetical protein
MNILGQAQHAAEGVAGIASSVVQVSPPFSLFPSLLSLLPPFSPLPDNIQIGQSAATLAAMF